MKKTHTMVKRMLSILLSTVMMLSIAISPLPGDLFSGWFGSTVADAAQPSLALTQSELALGVNVVPEELAGNESFMKRYVRTSGTSLNINSLWKKVSGNTKDVKGATDTLPTGTFSQNSSSKYWVAQYRWDLGDQEKSWLNQYVLKFEANLIPNKHEHGCGDDHWNDAYVTIRTKEWDLSTDYGREQTGQILGKSTERNERITINLDETISADWNGTSVLTYTAKHYGGQSCGGPKVSGSLFYLVDNSTPVISNAYLAPNADGTGSFGSHTRFGSNSSLEAYVVLQFSEKVRMADNYAKTDALTLDLEAYYGKDSGYVENSNCNITATLDSFTGDKMIFKFTIPSVMNGKNTHVYITGIKSEQSFNQSWDLKLFKGDGSGFATTGLTAANRITDLAGNSLNWKSSDKSFGTYYFDNVAPTMTSVNMTGSMITADSAKEPTGWEDNPSDRGANFAGVGDKVGFQVYFSENIANTGGMKAVLSLKDAAGNPIRLDVSKVSGNCITFKDITITEEMQCSGRILITAFENAGNLSDQAGNKVTTDMTGNIKVPNQQVFLDRDKPLISTSMDDPADGVYRTTNETLGGEYFTFPVVFKEDTSENSAPYISMINDLPVDFVIVTPGDSISFTYYMDDSPVAASEKFNDQNTVGSGVTVSTLGGTRYRAKDKVSDGNLAYLHIRLDPQHDYRGTATESDTKGVFFNGTIHFFVSDYAGNEGTGAFTVKHQVDTVAPSVEVSDNLNLNVDFENGTATVTATFSANDNYDLEKLYYQWHYQFMTDENNWQELTAGELQTVDLTGQMVRNYSGSTTYEFTFNPGDAFTNRVGEIKLTVTAEDRLREGEEAKSEVLAFDFRKPTGNYTVEGGSATDPVTWPSVYIGAAESTSTVSGGAARTIMLIKIEDREDGVVNYYMYDPQKYIDHDSYPNQTTSSIHYVNDVFEPLALYLTDPVENPIPENYGSWYEVCMNLSTGVCSVAELVIYDRDRSALLNFFDQAYGELEVTFVTSTEFGTYRYSATTISDNIRYPGVFTFTPGNETITTSTIYPANYAQYDIEIQAVKNEKGQDVRTALEEYRQYANPAMNTYPTLDGVAVTFKVTNNTDASTGGQQTYSLEAVDFEESKVELFYCGTQSGEAEILLETWNLEKTSDGVQTIVIGEDILAELPDWTGFKTGWYRLQVTVKNLNNRETTDSNYNTLKYQFTEEIYLYIDTTVLEMEIDTYYKEYAYGTYEVVVRDGGENSLYDFSEETLTNREIVLSLAENPSSWKQTTYLRFSRTLRGDGMGNTLQEKIQLRVRNATYDALGSTADSSAVWVDGSWESSRVQDATCGSGTYLASDKMYYFYLPTLVDGYQEGAYGEASGVSYHDETGLRLPMLEGYNLLVYEIVSTNGTVKTYEVPVFVYGQPEEWELEYTLELHNNGNVRSAAISAVVPGDMGLENSFFYHDETIERWRAGAEIPKSYTLTNDVNNAGLYLLDQNGNLSVKRLTIYDVDGSVLDIDGVAPSYMYVSSSGYDTDVDKLITVTVEDRESAVSAKDITLTFDADYSAVLLGKTGDERTYNTQLVTMSLPLAVDENGEYLTNEDGTFATWEEYQVGNYGVFRTRIIEETVNEETGAGSLSVEFWIVTKVDEENRSVQWTVSVSAADVYGNVTTKTTELQRGNEPYLGTGSLYGEDDYLAGKVNIDAGASGDGILGVWSGVPLSSLEGYGIGEMEQRYTAGQEQPVWFATAPMITEDDVYQLTAVDLFGEEYDLNLMVDDFGELGVSVSFSTTDPTNQPVTVMAQATGTVETITSIVSDTGVEGTIDPVDPTKANITVEDNCVITITTSSQKEDGSFVQRKVNVTNIDKKIDDTYFVYYDYMYDQLTGEEDEAYGEVTVYLMCDTEDIYTTNGPDTYTFPMGSSKGDAYTFEYVDRAGNVGSNTVVLPFDVLEIPAPPDREAPIVTFSLYGILNNRSEFIADLTNPIDDVVENVPVTAGELINTVVGEYRAQEVRIVLSIDDASDTKIVVVPTGTAAPTDYSAVTTASTVDFVEMSASKRKATLTIRENGVFDIYVIDANDIVSKYTKINVTAIDKEAPVYYADYELGVNQETGLPMVTATFLPEDPAEQFEVITAISQVLSKVVSEWTGEYEESSGNTDADSSESDKIYQDVIRYYTQFNSNGEFTFNYRDELGNLGQALAMVKGIDTSAAVLKSVIWYGTVGNVLPEVMKESGLVVNRDITAELNMSKPISNVVLYIYDETAENGAGELLSADEPVEISFTGTNIYITYTGNVEYSVVAEYTASASGRKGYYLLPAVECIDKKAPVITLVGEPELSENRRSAKVTFISDEPALLSQQPDGYVTEFTWTATTNAEKELCFTDKAGNRTIYTLKDLGIDEEILEVWYSAAADGTDATIDPLNDLTMDPGDTFYVKVSKDAEVILRGEEKGDAAADTWTALTLSDDSGLHIVQFKDKNTGEVFYHLVAAEPKDNIAPIITLDTATVVVDEGIGTDEMLAALRTGVTVTDDKDGVIDFTFTGHPQTAEAGLYSLTYTAVDAAGNRAAVYRNLYVMKEGTPILWINGEPGLPFGKVSIKDGENISLRMENLMEDEPIVVKYREGIKTSGQMKYYATAVEDMNFSVSKPGHYTIYVRSQDRVEYVTYIYVEDK